LMRDRKVRLSLYQNTDLRHGHVHATHEHDERKMHLMRDRKVRLSLYQNTDLRHGHVHATHEHDEREDELEEGQESEALHLQKWRHHGMKCRVNSTSERLSGILPKK